ncbi:MAG TPA: carboxylesterase/lipase family protein, partial [Firmicutes bacterium]|nr:carboxylesterase/lipase family protein [Bacillota bacterium]
TTWKAKAWQNHGDDDVVLCSEDCLHLNIWTKNPNAKNKPVVVWVHGGGFTSGSGADEFFNGATFSSTDEVVFVTVNYRLGVFGFLDVSPVLGEDYVGSSNNGILDIVEALRFISNHIEHFGGNPDLITVMGESAGAKCVSTLLTIEAARQLIHQVILQSGSVQCIRDVKTAQFV